MPMPWTAPYRPANEVTQDYNDGIVTIYAAADSAQPGYQPKPTLMKKYTLRYDEQRVGIQRYYEAMQNQVQVERVLRVPRAKITNQDIAETEDGVKYRIDLVQTVDLVYPPSLDLTLTRYEQGVSE